jgi:hypothetical protein
MDPIIEQRIQELIAQAIAPINERLDNHTHQGFDNTAKLDNSQALDPLKTMTELARITITAGNDGTSISTDIFVARKYLKVLVRQADNSVRLGLRFNSVGGTFYGWGVSRNTGTPTIGSTAAYLELGDNQNTSDKFYSVDILNIATIPKYANWLGQEAAPGTPTINNIVQGSGVWNNATNQITLIELLNVAGGSPANLGVGTEIIVLGAD